MTNKDLQALLATFPDSLEVRLCVDPTEDQTILPFDEDRVLLTSDTSYLDTSAPEDEWDNPDGKVMLGDGPKYLLINPPIH